MTLTQLKLRAVVLTAYMLNLQEDNKPVPAHRAALIAELGQQLDSANLYYPVEMARDIEQDLDLLLAAVDTVSEVI